MGEFYNRKEQEQKRKQLRNGSTAAEAVLWIRLKGSQLEGRKFRRQYSVESYILDFYCTAEKLAIELDGNLHFTIDGSRHDDDREKVLKKFGIRVLRYENKLIYNSIESVLEDVKGHFTTPELLDDN